MLSCYTIRFFCDSMDTWSGHMGYTSVAHQTLLCMGFPRQDYWSVLPFPSSGDLPDPGIKLMSPALAGWFFTTKPPWKPYVYIYIYNWLSPVI